MKFVHLGIDDKFIDFFYQACERLFPGENLFLVVDDKEAMKYVKSAGLVRRVKSAFLTSAELDDILKDCEILIVHFLTDNGIRLLCSVPEHVTVVWSGWGGDYYLRIPHFDEWAYGDCTRKVLEQLDDRSRPGLLQLLQACISRWWMKRKERNAIARVDFFSAPIPEDYELMKSSFPCFRAGYIQLNYGNVEEMFQVGPETVGGKNILVGNSADPSNNHLELFETLRKFDLDDRKVYVPLSYGDPDYRDCVIARGKALLGRHFEPLTDFIPLEDYTRIVSTCGTVIMNHRRQQALGNIGIAMYKGAKVFLNGKGVTFDFFVKRGAHVFDIESIPADTERIFQSLTESQVEDNRRVLRSFWAKEITDQNLGRLASLTRNGKGAGLGRYFAGTTSLGDAN